MTLVAGHSHERARRHCARISRVRRIRINHWRQWRIAGIFDRQGRWVGGRDIRTWGRWKIAGRNVWGRRWLRRSRRFGNLLGFEIHAMGQKTLLLAKGEEGCSTANALREGGFRRLFERGRDPQDPAGYRAARHDFRRARAREPSPKGKKCRRGAVEMNLIRSQDFLWLTAPSPRRSIWENEAWP